MSEYTPDTEYVATTEEIREYVEEMLGWEHPKPGAVFDRWLAEVERAAAEKAENERDCLRFELDGFRRVAAKDNEFLIGERDAALSAIANVKGFAEGLMHDEVEPYTRIGKMILAALGSVPSAGEGNDAVQGS